MLIGLCGPQWSGREEVSRYLASELGFTEVANPSLLEPLKDETCDASQDQGCGDASKVPSVQLTSQCWRSDINVVITNVEPHDPAITDLLKRPYFLLVYVVSPLRLRYIRAVGQSFLSCDDFMDFFEIDDESRYYGSLKHESLMNRSAQQEAQKWSRAPTAEESSPVRHDLRSLERLSRLHIINKYDDETSFRRALRRIDFTNKERLRPSWDTYFMSIAKLAAERTNCMKRRVGCVIARNKRIIATGYNGTPSGVKNCFEGGCPRCNGTQSAQGAGLDLCLCLHAEENAIIEAGRERCEGSTLYTNLFPCILCSKKIVQSGISRIVFDKHYTTDSAAESLLRAGDVVIDAFQGNGFSLGPGDLVLQDVR